MFFNFLSIKFKFFLEMFKYCPYFLFSSMLVKVIIHKSRGEVSLVEQDTIEYVSRFFFKIFFQLHFMQLFSADATLFKKKDSFFVYENMKNRPQKLPKSQFMFHKNCSPRDLCIITLGTLHCR